MDTTFSPSAPKPRLLKPALRNGFRRRCPNCGEGALFDGYLAVRDSCGACGQAFAGHRSDDMPPWLTMIVVGHLLAPLIIFVEMELAPPIWVSYALWPTIVLTLCFPLLPRFKGAIVALQWAKKLHGFADDAPRADTRAAANPWTPS